MLSARAETTLAILREREGGGGIASSAQFCACLALLL